MDTSIRNRLLTILFVFGLGIYALLPTLRYAIMDEEKKSNLSDEQKHVLKEYISNISNTNNFSTFVETQIPKLKTKLTKKVKKVKDKVLRIKLREAVNCVNKFCLNESKQTDDNSVVQLLRYYELDKELDKI